MSEERIAVVGLGYVGLPLAVAFAHEGFTTARPIIGFDINARRVSELSAARDWTGEIEESPLRFFLDQGRIAFTTDPAALRDASFVIVTVPTPITDANIPDLGPVEHAAATIGAHLARGAVVVLESTVYPGATREIFVPGIERASGMRCGADWFVGYSPERINPGDRTHGIATVVKVVAGMDATTADRIARVYGTACHAGVHRAPSIEVAEAAKVFENVQRDLGIAAVNELARICHLLKISALDVLSAARTKWNFVDYRPGLVGGHCIGVDPYYLAQRAQELGHHPEVLLAGRRVNDAMPFHVADRVLKGLIATGRPVRGARVLVLGLTFKPNVPDTRNSKVRDVITRLQQFHVDVVAHDPLLDRGEVGSFGATYAPNLEDVAPVDGIVIATLHDEFRTISPERFRALLKALGTDEAPGAVFDVSGFFAETLRGDPGIAYDTF